MFQKFFEASDLLKVELDDIYWTKLFYAALSVKLAGLIYQSPKLELKG